MKKVSLRVAALAGAAAISILGVPAAASASAHPQAAAGGFGHQGVTPTSGIRGSHATARTYASPLTSGGWSSQASEPVLYNYGLIYYGSVINPPSNIPPGAVITNICWTWNYTYPHPSSGIYMFLYDSAGYYFYNTSGNELGCSTADNGQPANQKFQFGFGSPGGSGGYYPPILPPAMPSGPSTINVSYSY